ncbi:hypothetical protein [Alteraurantiacibacter palmitatis]|uniref:Uncharacterized protein n=1 Tax=Alteraurantiacibacter palmitatis TaxID=2054628 RepID=A0ABV7E3Q2_9SPHN
MAIKVTEHAITRYRERVARLPEAQILLLLRGRAFEAADRFGAPFVRLPGGQRAVLRDHTIVTILPADCPAGHLDPAKDRR